MAVQEEGLSAFLSEERGRMADFDDKVPTHNCGRREAQEGGRDGMTCPASGRRQSRRLLHDLSVGAMLLVLTSQTTA